MFNFKIFISLMLGTLAPAIVIAVVGYAAVKAMRRNPSAGKKILITMVIAFVFVEAMVAMALIMLHLLYGR